MRRSTVLSLLLQFIPAFGLNPEYQTILKTLGETH
jgi:hypothetical protein